MTSKTLDGRFEASPAMDGGNAYRYASVFIVEHEVLATEIPRSIYFAQFYWYISPFFSLDFLSSHSESVLSVLLVLLFLSVPVQGTS
jgi:hypothetical protein